MPPESDPITTETLLREAGDAVDPIDARILLQHVLERAPAWLFAHGRDPVAPAHAAAFRALVARRAAGEPVAYLTGHRGFRNLDLAVGPATLIPRPETELLVELALARLPDDAPVRVADLGTGSGAIALALASERPRARVIAVDISDAALQVAADNARRLQLRNVTFQNGDWLAPLAGERFDMIVANPPYIADDDPHLRQGDLRFEPMQALVSGRDGLDAIRRIVGDAPAHLHPDGWLVLEHGWEQGDAVRALLHDAGFVAVSTERDLEQRERVTLGRIG